MCSDYQRIKNFPCDNNTYNSMRNLKKKKILAGNVLEKLITMVTDASSIVSVGLDVACKNVS